MSGVAVVTDSTSSLAPDVADRAGVVVVPLQVIVDGTSRPESFRPSAGTLSPGAVAAALREGRTVSTSRPSPEAFDLAYAAAAERGATSIVSVHLSGAISSTVDAAELAARSASIPVTVVDSRTVAAACGFAALAAASAARYGAGAEEVAGIARRRAAGASTYFCVESLEYLRRGGRIGAAQALLGSALAVKPLLTVTDGRITPYERVRTMSRALARLEELALEALTGSTGGADVAVVHLDNRSAADRLARTLRGRDAGGVSVTVSEISAVLGVHCGPGTVGVVVSPLD
ncbi:DegV family protein [Microlunatus aurantiacus]|uniref:DegV family protein n=1 Tax=Microlunatus aurantiacus TaxID=446786 RepID=A0ABP7CUB4_9ACTN